MSRKETVVNVLIGMMLVSAFAAFAGALWLALYGATLAVAHFFPRVGRASDVVFYGGLCLAMLLWSTQHLRKRLWPNAFLSLGVIPAAVLIWLAQLHSTHGRDEISFWAWPFFMIFVITHQRHLRRWEFVIGAVVLSASVALATGMLGSSALARYIVDGLIVCATARVVIDVLISGQSAPASSTTHA